MTDKIRPPSPGSSDKAKTQMTTSGMEKENSLDQSMTKEGSSFITLSPYTPPRTQKKVKKTFKVLDFDDIFGPQSWTKYYEIQAPVEDDLELYNKLAETVGTDVLFRRQADGVTIIEASNSEQSQKLHELIEAKDPCLPVKENKSLNACHGTIIVPHNIRTGQNEFAECNEKIKRNLLMQGHKIRDITTYTRPPRGGRKYSIRIAKITFEGRVLPDTVVVGGQRLSVREYVPAPRQCVKCWKYGHGYKYCKVELYVCPICGVGGHQKDNCTDKINKTCINCQGNHPAFSRSCAEYKKQQLIVKTQFKEGLSYKGAINRLKQTGEITSYNYKRALVGKNLPTTATPKVSEVSETNRYSVLQMEEDLESHAISQEKSQKSPKRKSKRGRDSSCEGGLLSPDLNPKQKPKIGSGNKGIEVHEVIAEIHAEEVLSMDDTVIYTDEDLKKLDIEEEKTTLSSELPSPTTMPSELLSLAIAPSELPSLYTVPSELPSLTDVPSESPSLIAIPSESPSLNVTSSESTLPTVTPSGSPLLTIPPSKLALLKKPQAAKVASAGTSENVKLSKTKIPSKIPKREGTTKPFILKKDGTSKPCPNKIKNLVHDYHMPPGFKDGK